MAAVPACATGGYYSSQRDYARDIERRAYQNGFDEGLRHGERDARDRRSAAFDRDGDYRDADRGYHRGDGDREIYRRAFRDGYRAGYTQGFDRVTGPYAPVHAAPPVPMPYENRNPPRGSYSSVAAQNGFRDGLEAGRDDARDRRASDPFRPKRYRSGDHDYDRRYGPKEEYQREYRAAFQQGYEQGYREYRR
jgi:hypothetical protein